MAMKQYIDLVISVLTLLTLVSGLYFAIRRFGLKRERFTFLRMAISATSVYGTGDLVLVVLTVHLENKGDTRINARQSEARTGTFTTRARTCVSTRALSKFAPCR